MYASRLISIGLLLHLSLSACQAATPSLRATSTSRSFPPSPRHADIVTDLPTATLPATPTATSTDLPIRNSILRDLRVRQAIAYCTDRAGLIRSVYPWLTALASYEADSFVPPWHWAYVRGDPDFTRYPFSPERGMNLLVEAGWMLESSAPYRTDANGEELALTLSTTDANFRQTWTAVWEEQMQICGIRITSNHTPAQWFFGDATGLRRREFEIAALAWVAEHDFGGLKTYTRYACDQTPLPTNNWQGQNFSGWCNEVADAELEILATQLNVHDQRVAFGVVQREYARDIPELPLFYRVNVFAVNPGFENFEATDDGIYTWNAAQWRIPSQETIVIGEDGEPAALLWFEDSYVAKVIRTLITGSDVILQNGEYQAMQLKQLPTLENGGVIQGVVAVKAGDSTVDWTGEVVVLGPGVVVRDMEGRKVDYNGGDLSMKQLIVTYEFADDLTWSDGVAVSSSDYELAYRAMCDTAIRGPGPFTPAFPDPFPACDRIANVEYLSDTTYRVTWKPGFSGARLNGRDLPYYLPPFSRLPAHQVLADGRKLADVPPGEWAYFEGVKRKPLGVGPYVIKGWVNGQNMVLEANPHYFQGAPATPRIVIKFLEHNRIIPALLAGEVDVVDWESIVPNDVDEFQLMQAQADGKVRLVALPSSTWELLTFALS
jgi:ABC-type transport system substrate-binding protein